MPTLHTCSRYTRSTSIYTDRNMVNTEENILTSTTGPSGSTNVQTRYSTARTSTSCKGSIQQHKKREKKRQLYQFLRTVFLSPHHIVLKDKYTRPATTKTRPGLHTFLLFRSVERGNPASLETEETKSDIIPLPPLTPNTT